MRKLNAVSMHVSSGFVTIFPAYYRKKVSLLPIENSRSFCTWPLWQRSGEGALPLTLPCLSTTEKMPRHGPTARERHAEHPGHEPARFKMCRLRKCQLHSMTERQTCSLVPQDFLFVELDVSLEITLGAQGGEALESLKTTGGAQSRFYNAITIKRSLSSH